MRILMLALLTGLCAINSSSQGTDVDRKIKKAFTEYFGPKQETIFLHLNKSTYIVGEQIWFKGYIYNRTKSAPFIETTNLQVGIYDSIGNQIAKKLFSAKNGYATGQIALDSAYQNGTYYLKASTNWMRNFDLKGNYIQKIKVLAQNSVVNEIAEGVSYDVQFLPEGGKLVAGVRCTIGIKAINQFGYAVSGAAGTIKNARGELMAKFETDGFGLAKIDFVPEEGSNYNAAVSFFDGQRKTFFLPKVENKGINIAIAHLKDDKVFLMLGTNTATKSSLEHIPSTILIHRDGLLKMLKVEFPNNEQYASFVLDKNELLPGINVVTLVNDEGIPILERLFFNHVGLRLGNVDVSTSRIDTDSTSIKIKTPLAVAGENNLSISVLPSGTKSYQHRKNSISTFFLEPYVKGFIEYPSYYFKEVTHKKEQQLDLLLLTQGWSSYDWDRIYDHPPKKTYAFKRGVTLEGVINSKLKSNDQLLFYANKGSLPAVVPLSDGAKTFEMPNYFAFNGSKVQFSIIQNNGMLTRPAMYLTLEGTLRADRIYDTWPDNLGRPLDANTLDLTLPTLLLPDNTIKLDEVTVVEKQEKERFITPIIFENRLTVVDKQIRRTYPNLLELVRSKGFDVRIPENPPPGVFNRVLITTRRPMSLSDMQPSPILYIDDVLRPSFDVLLDYPTAKVESFFIDRSGNGEAGGGGGVIRIYTRPEGELASEYKSKRITSADKFLEYTIDGGFEPSKKFYVPRYTDTRDTSFTNYGVIHWVSNVVTDINGTATFKIPNTDVEEVSFFIEGMGKEGTLFSTVEKIRLE